MKAKFLFAVISFMILNCCCNNQQPAGQETSTDSAKADLNVQTKLKEEDATYKADGLTMNGFVAFDEHKKGPRPAILVVHEWWGLNDYIKNRVRQLAGMGFIAMAVDMYGDGKIASNPGEAQTLATPFYKNPKLAKTRLDAALIKLKQYAQTDSSNIAAIGYCYGGYVVLNAAKLGADLKGVVSFHGGLGGVQPDKKMLKAKVLVCHGGADKFESAEEIKNFKKGMDSIGADYTFKVYANATHAFTNPDATANGKKFNMPIEYNAEADKDSWNDMQSFFNTLFNK